MIDLDPLSRPVAIAEIVLLLLLAAFVGWLLGRWLPGGRIRSLERELTAKEAELEACRRGDGPRGYGANPPAERSGTAADAPVERSGNLPAGGTPEAVALSPDVVVNTGLPVTPDEAPVANVVNAAPPDDRHSEAAILARVAARAHELNFDRIGHATPAEADDLKDIAGIGPFLERKLHSLGIYTFRQIANFTKEDIRQVNEIIEFFPGRIERDDWVGQASDFHRQKHGPNRPSAS